VLQERIIERVGSTESIPINIRLICASNKDLDKEVQNGNAVAIKCDSMYSIDCISKWAISWEKKNWTKKGGEIKNLEIIKKAYYLYNDIKENISLTHIKAHVGFEGNELADRMTMYAIQKKNEAFVRYSDEIDISVILKMRAG